MTTVTTDAIEKFSNDTSAAMIEAHKKAQAYHIARIDRLIRALEEMKVRLAAESNLLIGAIEQHYATSMQAVRHADEIEANMHKAGNGEHEPYVPQDEEAMRRAPADRDLDDPAVVQSGRSRDWGVHPNGPEI